MRLENRSKNLVQKIMIISLSYLVLQMKEDQVSIHAILIKERYGLKMRKETFSLFMLMGILLKKCQFLSIWIKWWMEQKIKNLNLLECLMENLWKMNANFYLLQSRWLIQDFFMLEMMELDVNFLMKSKLYTCLGLSINKNKIKI